MARVEGFPTSFGNKRVGCATVAGPSSYTTGGFTVEAKTLGIHAIEFAVASSSNDDYFTSVLVGTDNIAASSVKVQVFLASSGAELSGTNLSGVVFRVLGIGL